MRLTVSTGIDSERVKEYVFDEFGRTMKETVKGNDASRSVYYSYDIAGNLLTEEDNAGRITSYEYDGLGNPLTVTRADGVKESYEYDPLGNVLIYINGEGEVTNYGYDVLGRNIYTDNGISRVEYYYDGEGNVLREKDGNGNITYYTYDSRGFLSASKKGSITTEYLYDGEGRVIKQSYGATGEKERISQYYEISEDGLLLKETDNLSQSAYYSYDDLGNLVKYTDKNGVTTSYIYDGLNRLVKEANGVDADITYTYDSLGQLSKVQRGESYISYSYDGIGQVISEKSENGEKRYSYDKVGNLTEKYIYDKMGAEIESSYTYDVLSRVTSINTHMGKEVLSYDRAGRITKSENTSTGESIRYWYNRDNTVSKVIHENNGEMLFSEHYEYDKNGNRIYAAMDTEVTEYSYDKNDRLTRVKKNDDYVIYEFDSFSNIKTEYTTKGNFIDRKEYYYDKLNRLTVMTEGDVTTSYSYDKKGQLTEKRKMYSDSSVTESYVYSGRGELLNVFGDNLTAEYTYGADGYRSGKTVNGETSRFVYDGMNIVAEETDRTIYRYARGSCLLGYDSSKGDSVYYRQNAHGDVIALTNGMGDILWDYTYDAYGEEEKKSNNPFRRAFGKKEPHNPFRYAGEYTDEETGLIYLRARYYDSSIGRFTAEDPIKDGLNWYVYCGGNPINRVDPWGLDSYVLYDPILFDPEKYGDKTGEERAKQLKKELEKYYGTECHIIPITIADSTENPENAFVQQWNDMGSNGNPIDAVVLLFHGNSERIAISYENDDVETTRFSIKDMGKLTNEKEMDTIVFLACKTGSPNESGTSIANEFAKNVNAKRVVASDYRVRPHVKTSFLWWGKYMSIKTEEISEGFKVFYPGVGKTPRIGTSFKGIGELLNEAREHNN